MAKPPSTPGKGNAQPVDESRVAALLTESLERHKAACVARQKNQANARDLLIEARDRRLEAETLDPEHTALAWKTEQKETPLSVDTHQALLNFYARQIGI